MNSEITFGNYPVEFSIKDDEVYISCKGVVGTLSQVEGFIKDKFKKLRHYFGKSKIRHWHKGLVKIDCLEDTEEKVILIYKHLL
jgi:hypothetical protein